VLVAGGGYRGTGFLIDGPDGDVLLVTTLHTFVEIEPEPLGFPLSITCTYVGTDGTTWTELVNWAPLNPTPNLLEDWVVLRVADSGSTKRWRLATALEREIDGKPCEWTTHGFPAGFDEGLGAGGRVTTIGGVTPPYKKTELAGNVPVLQLFVDQMQTEQVPAVGFSGGPIVVGERVVGVFRSFPPRGNAGLDAILAGGATVFAIPIHRIAAALMLPVPQPWSRADQQAQELLDLKRPARNRKLPRLLVAPSELLRADAQTVDFESTGRETNLEQLEALVEGSVPYHVFAAEGGSGKTRLLIEFCERMRERGWIAGFVPNSMPVHNPGSWVRSLCAGQVCRLLVFDYVEAAPLPAAKVIAMSAGLGTRIRVVLLSRDKLIGYGPAWWERLIGTSGVPKYDSAWTELPPMYADLGARARGFEAAVRAFYGEPPDPPSDLDHELLSRPLYLHSLALLVALGELPDLRKLNELGILSEILRHERAAWTRWYEANCTKHIPMGFPRAVDAIVTVATLLGECSHMVGCELARAALDELDHDELGDAAKCVREVYGNASLRPLEPDPLGEHLVHDTLERGDVGRWLSVVADPQRNLSQLTRALTVMAGMAQTRPQAREWLGQLLREHGVVFIRRIAEGAGIAATAEDSLGLAMANAAGSVLDLELATAFNLALPTQTVELRELAVLSSELVVRETRASGGGDDVLGRALNNLGVRLSELGRREDALAATGEAVNVYREVAKTRPDAFPILAAALNNLGNQLSELGRLEDALTATQEAVDGYRELATAQPDHFFHHLANALNNLGNRLSDLGRREDALTATEEAVNGYRELAKVRSEVFRRDLAKALNNLGNQLSALGRREDALAATEEAVNEYRELAKLRPDAFLPNFAAALINLGTQLNALGRRQDGLVPTEAAINLYRDLAKARPDAFLPDFAAALNNLGNHLSELGRREDALTATDEAVNLYRELAKAQPDAFLPYVALGLNNLGTRLSELGRREDALAAADEAVNHYRELAKARPDACLPGLAKALNNLGIRLSELGRREDALAAADEAVNHYRELAEVRPHVFLPDLAKAHNNLGNRLSELGRREDALGATDAAVNLYRELAKARSNAFLPDLAHALNNLGTQLSELGKPQEALTATDEAVNLYRELAKAQPDAFLPDVAMALNNLGTHLNALGRREEALAATEKAVSLYRELAKARPDAFLPDLANALINLGIQLSALGRREDALEPTDEAVNVCRELAKGRPDAFLPNLAMALHNLGHRLNELGRQEDALAVIDEAVKLRRELAKARPQVFVLNLARSLAVLGALQGKVGQAGLSVTAFVESLRLLIPLFIRNQQAHARLTVSIVIDLVATCRGANLDIPEDVEPFVEEILAALSPGRPTD
jgi:hypothetical protein